MVHLVLLGALTHAAMVWSTHFSAALLKTRPELDDRSRQSQRLLLLLVGVSLVVVGVPWELWPVTVTGATAVAAAVVWHGIQLWRRLRASLPAGSASPSATTSWPPPPSPSARPMGDPRPRARRRADRPAHRRAHRDHGSRLARDDPHRHARHALADHAAHPDGPARRALRPAGLPWLVVAVVAVATGATLGSRWATVTGLAMYVAALLWWGRALILPARTAPRGTSPPARCPSRSAGSSSASSCSRCSSCRPPTWEDVDHGYQPLATALAIGFAAQLLVGALSYLVPSVLGGGPSVVRTGLAWLDRWSTARLVATNLGLLLVLLPVPDSVKVAGGVLVGAAVLIFVPLMGAGIRAAVTARENLLTEVAQRPADG